MLVTINLYYLKDKFVCDKNGTKTVTGKINL